MSWLYQELLQISKRKRQFNRKVRGIHEHLFQRWNVNGQKHDKMFKLISKTSKCKIKPPWDAISHSMNWHIWKYASFIDWWRCGTTSIPILGWWESILQQSLWKQMWYHLTWLNICVSCGPILLLVIWHVYSRRPAQNCFKHYCLE